ncbi:hypothetical protein F2Q69_00036020 [Brassica cretica]|uniref:Uncharacterized protein n=1 Tax=Brassica cretica TaxID=69181 RepID=A0A8S9SK14_BRACR|nr:hypothetical protein F2Q69_00036020 [Brassica cretica]
MHAALDLPEPYRGIVIRWSKSPVFSGVAARLMERREGCSPVLGDNTYGGKATTAWSTGDVYLVGVRGGALHPSVGVKRAFVRRYCFTLRIYNGEWQSDSLEAATMVLSVSSVLGQKCTTWDYEGSDKVKSSGRGLKKKLKLADRKVYFMMCWVNEQTQTPELLSCSSKFNSRK